MLPHGQGRYRSRAAGLECGRSATHGPILVLSSACQPTLLTSEPIIDEDSHCNVPHHGSEIAIPATHSSLRGLSQNEAHT